MKRMWLRWRLRVWHSRESDARTRLELFNQYPHRACGNASEIVRWDLENSLNRASFRRALVERELWAVMRPEPAQARTVDAPQLKAVK